MPALAEPQADILTDEQVAQYLQLHLKTVQHYCRVKELPGFQVGRHWRITREDLERFIESRRKRR